MPSQNKTGRGTRGMTSAYYRVKANNKAVFTALRKADCKEFIRRNPNLGKMKLVPPNI